MGRLEGKTAIITGSNRGIGRATAQLFTREGANVVINYSKSDKQAEDTLKAIKEDGGSAIIIKADVSKEAEMNNAAIVGPLKPITEYSETEWDEVININLKGAFFCIKHIIPIMLKKEKGKIINISSISIIGDRDDSAYCATKGGLASLTRELSLEYAGTGININAICPGAVNTEMLKKYEEEYPGLIDGTVRRTPSARLATPEDVAYAALYLSSDESDFVNGILLFVDGALKNNIL